MFLRLNQLKQEAAEQSNSQTAEPSKPAKPKPEVEKVKMDDGREVEFVGKRKLIKDYTLNDDGSLGFITLDFRNGMTRKIVIPPSLLGQFAGHGAIQKYGDELAGLKGVDESGKPVAGLEPDIEDMVLAIDELDQNVQAGKWSTRVPGDGMGGTSVLIKALIEYGGKTVEQVKAFLKDKDSKFKTALRLDDKRPNKAGLTMAAIVKKIEAEKASKGPKVDTSAALADLDAMGEEAVAE